MRGRGCTAVYSHSRHRGGQRLTVTDPQTNPYWQRDRDGRGSGLLFHSKLCSDVAANRACTKRASLPTDKAKSMG